MAGGHALSMTAPGNVYQARRARLARGLNRPIVIFAGRAPARNYATNPYPFRAQSTYLYFGGPPVEGSALVIEPGSDGRRGTTSWRIPPDPDDEVWVGPMPDEADLAHAAGLEPGHLRDLDQLGSFLSGRNACALPVPCPVTQAQIRRWGLDEATPDEKLVIIEMRLIKDDHELQAMRRAAEVTMLGHRAALASCRPGAAEAHVNAAFGRVLLEHQCRESFTSIITVRGEVLHCTGYSNTLRHGALLLVDAGAEEPGGYAGDVTRTYPVSGAFTPLQRALHDAVHRAMQEAIEQCRPGVRYRDVHFRAAHVLTEGLVDAGLLKGDPSSLTERGAHTLFFPHGVGHLLGLDVHDMEDYGDLAGYAPGRTRSTRFGTRFLRLDRDLEPGMCVTVEPGIYLIPGVWKREELFGPYRDCVDFDKVHALLKEEFGGIRLEQDVHVRDADPEVLTQALPVQADDVESLIGRPIV